MKAFFTQIGNSSSAAVTTDLFLCAVEPLTKLAQAATANLSTVSRPAPKVFSPCPVLPTPTQRQVPQNPGKDSRQASSWAAVSSRRKPEFVLPQPKVSAQNHKESEDDIIAAAGTLPLGVSAQFAREGLHLFGGGKKSFSRLSLSQNSAPFRDLSALRKLFCWVRLRE